MNSNTNNRLRISIIKLENSVYEVIDEEKNISIKGQDCNLIMSKLFEKDFRRENIASVNLIRTSKMQNFFKGRLSSIKFVSCVIFVLFFILYAMPSKYDLNGRPRLLNTDLFSSLLPKLRINLIDIIFKSADELDSTLKNIPEDKKEQLFKNLSSIMSSLRPYNIKLQEIINEDRPEKNK